MPDQPAQHECSLCEKPVKVKVRGWCWSHYQRWYRYGDPKGPHRPSEEERFWARVDKTTKCWLWTSSRCVQTGYAAINFQGKRRPVQYVAYQLLVGPVPNGLVLDHLCKVRHCVNPAHLEPVTLEENGRRHKSHNKMKTHCPQGHAYAIEGGTRSNGWRYCRACNRERVRKRWRDDNPRTMDAAKAST